MVLPFESVLDILVVVGHSVVNVAHSDARLELNVIERVLVAGPAIFVDVLGLQVVRHTLELLFLLRVLPEVFKLIIQ